MLRAAGARGRGDRAAGAGAAGPGRGGRAAGAGPQSEARVRGRIGLLCPGQMLSMFRRAKADSKVPNSETESEKLP